MEIPDTMLAAAVEAVVGRALPEERLQALIDRAVEKRVGTVSIAWLAEDWECDEKTVKRKLKQLKVPLTYLSRKMVRVKVSELEAALDARVIRPKAGKKASKPKLLKAA